MVRRCAGCMLVLALLSCGNSRFAARDHGSSYESVDGERDDALAAFETLERLKDDPVDPRRASIEELLSIPGFPEPLARNVVRAIHGRRSGRSWVEDLTPPERAQLYCFEEFLRLPERSSTSVHLRVTEDGFGSEGPRRSDCRSALAGDCWKVLARSRDFDVDRQSSFYASTAFLAGALRFHAGGFVPDCGMGLVFGGGFNDYPLSDTRPMRGSRWITGSTSFYGRALWGGAVELWHRDLRAVFITGRPRTFKSDRFELDRQPVRGGCVSLNRGSLDAGLSAVRSEGAPCGAVCGINGRWNAGGLGVAFEVAGDGSGDPSCAWGVSYRGGKTRSAFFFHAIPPGMSGPFSRIDARQLAPAYSYHGVTAAGEREILRGIRVRASLEHYARSDGFGEDGRDVFRVECERGGGKLRVRLAWSSRTENGSRLIPCPGEGGADSDRDAGLGFLSAVKIGGGMTGKISSRYSEGIGHRGVVVSPSISLGLLSGRITLSGTFTAYRTFEGRQMHYFYEPSPEGAYPWIATSGNGNRGSFLMSFKYKGLGWLSKVVLQDGKPPEAAFQAALNID